MKLSDADVVEPMFCMHGTRAGSVAMTNPTKPRRADVAMSGVPFVTCTELGRGGNKPRGVDRREGNK